MSKTDLKIVNPEQDLEINELALDQEWIQQSSRYYYYSSQLAEVQRAYNEAKSQVDVVKLEVYQTIVATPEAYGFPEGKKPAETAITLAINASSEVQEAMKEVYDAKHSADVLQGAVSALDHKKRALEKLVDLHLANYYSDPKSPADDGEQREQRKKKARSKGTRK